MAIKHINPKAKEESGVIVSGKDAKKVATILSDKSIAKSQFRRSSKSLSDSLRAIQTLTIKTAS
jgi:hypothetical protein